MAIFQLAAAYERLGNSEQALDALEKAEALSTVESRASKIDASARGLPHAVETGEWTASRGAPPLEFATLASRRRQRA